MPSAYFNTASTPPCFMAECVTFTTLTGHGYYEPPPYRHGNCFSVRSVGAPKGEPDWRVLNFNHENLDALVEMVGPVRWPIRCAILDAELHLALIHDPRIPAAWYEGHWCESCCPHALLPLPQRLAGLLREETGQEKTQESGSFTLRHVGRPAGEFEKRRDNGQLFFPSLLPLRERAIPAWAEFLEAIKGGHTATGSPNRVLPPFHAMRELVAETYEAYRAETKLHKRFTQAAEDRAAEHLVRASNNMPVMLIHDYWSHRIEEACLNGTCP